MDLIKLIDDTLNSIKKYGISREDYKKLREELPLIDIIDERKLTSFKSNNFVDDISKELLKLRKQLLRDKEIDAVKDIEKYLSAISRVRNTYKDVFTTDKDDIKDIYTLVDYKKTNLKDIPFNILVENHLEELTSDIDIQRDLKEILSYTDDEKVTFTTLGDLLDFYSRIKIYNETNIDNDRTKLTNALLEIEIKFPLCEASKELLINILKPSSYHIVRTMKKLIETIGD